MVERLPTFESQLTPSIVRTPGVSVAAATATSRALGDVGRGLEAVGVGLERQNARQRQKQEIDEAKRRDSEWRRFKTESVATLTQKWREDFETSKSSAPPGAKGFVDGFRETTNKDIETHINQLNISDEELRTDVRDRLVGLQTTFIGPAASFQAAEGLRNRVANTRKATQNLGNLAVTNPENYRDYLSEGLQTINDSELTAEAKDKQREDFKQSLTSAVLNTEISENPSDALDRINEGEFDDIITPQVKSRATSNAKAEIERNRRQAEARQREIERQTTQDVALAVEQIGAGFPVAGLGALQERSKGLPAGEVLSQALDLQGEIKAHTAAPLRDQLTALQEMQAEGGTPQDFDRFTALAKSSAEAVKAQQQGKQLDYATRAGLIEIEPIDFGSVESWGLRMRQASGVADHFGAQSVAPLRSDEEDAFEQFIDNLTPENKLSWAASMQQGLDKDDNSRLRQMVAKTEAFPAMELSLDLIDRDIANLPVARRLLSAMEIDEKDIPITPADKKITKDAVTAKFLDQGGIFSGGGFGGLLLAQANIMNENGQHIAMTDRMLAATRQLALVYQAEGKDSADQQAMTDLWGDYEIEMDEDFAMIAVPKTGVEVDTILDGLQNIRNNSGEVMEFRRSLIDSEVLFDETVRDFEERGVWVNHGNGFALIGPSGDALTRENGEVFVVTPQEASAAVGSIEQSKPTAIQGLLGTTPDLALAGRPS